MLVGRAWRNHGRVKVRSRGWEARRERVPGRCDERRGDEEGRPAAIQASDADPVNRRYVTGSQYAENQVRTRRLMMPSC